MNEKAKGNMHIEMLSRKKNDSMFQVIKNSGKVNYILN